MRTMIKTNLICILAILTIISTIANAYSATPPQRSNAAIYNTHPNWKLRLKNAGYIPTTVTKNESAIELIRELPESMQELAGTVTNPLGIRDDILEYTLATFKDDPKALSAAIAVAQYDYWGSFSGNKELARKFYQTTFIADWCVDYFSDFQTGLKYSRNLAKLLRNTPERKKHQRYIEANYLSPGIYGFGNLTDKELAQKCEQGNY